MWRFTAVVTTPLYGSHCATKSIAYSDGQDVRFATASKFEHTPDRVCRGGWDANGGEGEDRAMVTALAFDAVSMGVLYVGWDTGKVMVRYLTAGACSAQSMPVCLCSTTRNASFAIGQSCSRTISSLMSCRASCGYFTPSLHSAFAHERLPCLPLQRHCFDPCAARVFPMPCDRRSTASFRRRTACTGVCRPTGWQHHNRRPPAPTALLLWPSTARLHWRRRRRVPPAATVSQEDATKFPLSVGTPSYLMGRCCRCTTRPTRPDCFSLDRTQPEKTCTAQVVLPSADQGTLYVVHPLPRGGP